MSKARLYYFFPKFTHSKIGNKIQQTWKIEWDKKKKIDIFALVNTVQNNQNKIRWCSHEAHAESKIDVSLSLV